MKYIFIINPVSGNHNHSEIIRRIHDYMEKKHYEYDIHFTKEPGDATLISQRYLHEKRTIIYAVGGDGTLNEVVNGIAKSKLKLGIIPVGSGNDFYRVLENTKRKNLKIDLGMVNDKYFINIASVGIDAQVAHNVKIFKKQKFPKKSIYDLSIIYTFLKFKYQNFRIKYKKKAYDAKYLIIAVCNGRYYGGGYQIAPMAAFDDNNFDVYFAGKVSKMKIPALISLLKKAKHENSPTVKKERLKEITISSDKNIICNYDGENLIAKKLVFKMVRDSINIYNDKELVNFILNKKNNA